MNRGRKLELFRHAPEQGPDRDHDLDEAEHEDQPDDPDSLTLERGLLKRRKGDIDQGRGLRAAPTRSVRHLASQ